MNLPLDIDRASAVPLQDQLFEQLRQLVLTGGLKPNSRIIATRFLAEQVGVSRTTVLLAYERLISEGYLETRPAIGTFVCSAPPDQPNHNARSNGSCDTVRQAFFRPSLFSGMAASISEQTNGIIDFSPSRPGISHLLPSKDWLDGMRSVFKRDPLGLASPQPASGIQSLRQAIADHLAASRGIMASPDQVIVVAGKQQACNLVAHLFQRRGDHVVLESPGDKSIVNFFKQRDAKLIHVPVDEHGLKTDQLPDGLVSLAYVSPARQNPLGGTMSQTRRTDIINWAREVGAYIIEDDSDSDFRYHGTTPRPLAALDPYGLVFYSGSFAKTLGAGLGLGYLVAPAEFVDAITAIKSLAEDSSSWLQQMVVGDLLVSGEYDHHLRRSRKTYLERRDTLISELQVYFGEVYLVGTEIGTQLTWVLPERFPSAQVVREAAHVRGVNIECVAEEGVGSGKPGSYCERTLIFSYAALTPGQIRQGIARLAEALK